MRVSESSFVNNFLFQTGRLQNQQNVLQNEATTGLKVSLPEDDPAAMASALNLQTSSSANSQYQSNITQLQNSATSSYDAMNTLQSLVTKASEIASTASTGTTSTQQMTLDVPVVNGLLQQALAIGNTKDSSGHYIFGGTNTTQPPFAATLDANGNITGVTYQGNTSTAKSEISAGVTVSAQTLGANTSGTGPAGLFTDSRSGADVFNHLISLRDNLTSGNSSAILNTNAAQLNADQNNAGNQIGSNAVLQTTLSDGKNNAAQLATNLTTQVSNLTNADLATTITQLQQTQTSYQAALESGLKVMQMSLINFMG